MAEENKVKSQPPKGTPKGGARYPRYALKDALAWVPRLVSNTHLAPQPRDIISASVVNSKGVTAEIKISALKQFGLIDGSSQAYSATELSRLISNSLPEETSNLLAKAALTPAIFKGLYDTFHGDEVSVGKLRQRAADLKVHPDNLIDCVKIYVESLLAAKMVSVDGDKVTHSAATASEKDISLEITESNDTEPDQRNYDQEVEYSSEEQEFKSSGDRGAPRAIFNVNVNLDSSLDTDKLERQLALLKRFGAI